MYTVGTRGLDSRNHPPRARGGPTPVAVRTADLALVQLIHQPLGATAASHKRGDVFRLWLQMIELKHKRVRQAAFDSRRCAKTFEHDADSAPICCHAPAHWVLDSAPLHN